MPRSEDNTHGGLSARKSGKSLVPDGPLDCPSQAPKRAHPTLLLWGGGDRLLPSGREGETRGVLPNRPPFGILDTSLADNVLGRSVGELVGHAVGVAALVVWLEHKLSAHLEGRADVQDAELGGRLL